MAPPERCVDEDELAGEVVVVAGDVWEEWAAIDEEADEEDDDVEVAAAAEARLAPSSVKTDADGLAEESEEYVWFRRASLTFAITFASVATHTLIWPVPPQLHVSHS